MNWCPWPINNDTQRNFDLLLINNNIINCPTQCKCTRRSVCLWVSSNSSNIVNELIPFFPFSRHTHSVSVAAAPILANIVCELQSPCDRWHDGRAVLRYLRGFVLFASRLSDASYLCAGVLRRRHRRRRRSISSSTIQIRSYSVCAQRERREIIKCIYRNSYAFYLFFFVVFFVPLIRLAYGQVFISCIAYVHERVMSASRETNNKREKKNCVRLMAGITTCNKLFYRNFEDTHFYGEDTSRDSRVWTRVKKKRNRHYLMSPYHISHNLHNDNGNHVGGGDGAQ